MENTTASNIPLAGRENSEEAQRASAADMIAHVSAAFGIPVQTANKELMDIYYEAHEAIKRIQKGVQLTGLTETAQAYEALARIYLLALENGGKSA